MQIFGPRCHILQVLNLKVLACLERVDLEDSRVQLAQSDLLWFLLEFGSPGSLQILLDLRRVQMLQIWHSKLGERFL